MTPRRFEVHPDVCLIPTDVLAWCLRTAEAHEEEWGLGEEDVSIIYPLCGSRGPVLPHVDFDYVGDELIYGLIVSGWHQLVCEKTGVSMPLAQGTVYVLDPATEHGTRAGHDDRLLFLVNTFKETDAASPAELAERLIASARRVMAQDGLQLVADQG